MGVFGKKNKGKDQEAYGGPDGPDLSPPKSSTLYFKRKQKNAVAPKFDFDLDSALPDSNEFRTSMLMPKLSARFSMLREQDDPDTKVGKASDDSVLFPKRASRLNLFNHNPLANISELSPTFKPPFADAARAYSLSEGYASDDGSIMARSRHLESNTLFGGRQKMYKIPTWSDSDRTLPKGGEKHTYRDDVSLSAFRQYQHRASEDTGTDRDMDHDTSRPSHEEQHESFRANSRATAFSNDRGTTSSTTSGPSNRRTSTAATSIASDSPILKQSISAASKAGTSDNLNAVDEHSVGREPPMPNTFNVARALSSSKSAVNLSESFHRQTPYAPVSQAVSHPQSTSQTLAALESALQDQIRQTHSQRRRYQTVSPSSDGDRDDGDHIYSNALQPRDRGKATAMGLFNRPAQQFDEQQFLERQSQMNYGRSSPLPPEPSQPQESSRPLEHSQAEEPSRPLEPSRHVERSRTPEPSREVRPGKENATGTRAKVDSLLEPSGQSTATPSPQPGKIAATAALFDQKVQAFNAMSKSESPVARPVKKSERQVDTPTAPSNLVPSMKARVESLIRRKNAELAAMEAERAQQSGPRSTDQHPASPSSSNTSRRDSHVSGAAGSDHDAAIRPRASSTSPLPPADIHPAFREGAGNSHPLPSVTSGANVLSRQSQSSTISVPPSMHSEQAPASVPSSKPGESPPPDPGPGLGLNGLISRHLRHDSDRSSTQVSSPRVAGFYSEASRKVSMTSTTHTINAAESVHSDPWEFDRSSQARHEMPSNDRRPSEQSSPAASTKVHPFFELDEASGRPRQFSPQATFYHSESSTPDKNMQDESDFFHKRAESTETQRERQEFDDDLAERQRKIQERLKAISDSQQRSRSQIRQALPQAFQGLMPKAAKGTTPGTSTESLPMDKTARILGFGSRTSEEESRRLANAQAHQDHQHQPTLEQQQSRYDERQSPFNDRPSQPVDASYAQSNGRRTPGGRTTPGIQPSQPLYGNMSYEDFERQRQRSATPNSGRAPSAGRHRASSSAAPQSRSRQAGAFRDEENYSQQSSSRNSPVYTRNGVTDDMRGSSRTAYYEDTRSPSVISNHSKRSNSRPPPQGPGHLDSGTSLAEMPPRSLQRPPPAVPPMVPQSHPQRPPSNYSQASPSMMVPSHGAAAESVAALNGRKRPVHKGMISEPTFVSSTSSVPVVGLPAGPRLPRDGESPPVPPMNPDRRRPLVATGPVAAAPGWRNFSRGPLNSPTKLRAEDSSFTSSSATVQSRTQPYDHQMPMIYTTTSHEAEVPYASKNAPRKRNRLRKISSEGGNLSARARQQAFRDELEIQKSRSPALPSSHTFGAGPGGGGGGHPNFDLCYVRPDGPGIFEPPPRLRPEVFPNRSESNLGLRARQEGGMF
ncbi:hypothetical protein DV735_g5805, partial [Chaetothyriales sp. CBS 134920]